MGNKKPRRAPHHPGDASRGTTQDQDNPPLRTPVRKPSKRHDNAPFYPSKA